MLGISQKFYTTGCLFRENNAISPSETLDVRSDIVPKKIKILLNFFLESWILNENYKNLHETIWNNARKQSKRIYF